MQFLLLTNSKSPSSPNGIDHGNDTADGHGTERVLHDILAANNGHFMLRMDLFRVISMVSSNKGESCYLPAAYVFKTLNAAMSPNP